MTLMRSICMMEADRTRSHTIFTEIENGIRSAASEHGPKEVADAISRARKALHKHDREVHVETTLEIEPIDGSITDHAWRVLVRHPDGRYVAIFREP
jgi:hypothetical protein